MKDTKLVSLKDKVTTVRDLMLSNKEQILAALPRHLSVDRLIRTAMTSVSTTPGLMDCTPRSLLGAVIQCAQLGLEPGILGMAYLVPFRNNRQGTQEVQFIPGYKGLIALARRSGEISTIMAHAVHAQDQFQYEFGTDPRLVHVPSEAPDRGAVTHYYAVARLKDGGVQFEVMQRAEVEAHRDRYSKAAKMGPWVTEFDEMAKKTVLRRLCKLLPASIELHTAIALDERAEAQIPQGLGDLAALPEPEGEAKSALDRLAETLEKTEGVEA